MSMEANPRKLSVAMIVRDAADALSTTLDSIQSIADEIVVVNTGSQDNTLALAQTRGAKAISHPWEDSFSAARNFALSHVTGDWVLWLDAGETLDADDLPKLRAFVDQEAETDLAYVMIVKVPQTAGGIGSEQIGKIRLLPNNGKIRFEGRVRETPLVSLAECEMQLAALPFPIRRSSHEHDPQRKTRKAVRDVQLVNLEIHEVGPSARLLICMAEAMQALGDHQNALTFYQQAGQLAEENSTESLEAYYGVLTALDEQEDGLEKQIQTCLAALEYYPLDAQLLCAMGGYLQSQGQLELATRSFETAYKYGQINPETWHIEDIDQIAVSCFALAKQLSGEPERAEEILNEALAEHPTSIRLRRQIIDMHVKYARRPEAMEHVQQLPVNFPNREAYRSAVRGATAAAQKNWVAARPYLETAYRNGCRESLCLRWLSVTQLALGLQDEAIETLNEWRSIDATSLEPQQLLASIEQANATVSIPGESRTIRIDTSPEAARGARTGDLPVSKQRNTPQI
ncbi:tetratricopeptide repeat-containing glycosyltransferase family 2 protein [Blastopirellula retiformator]|uniref:SPBc2 prophage-derived glycosyltransferase SunS n=1 Tax=Blastopirellula retiformator TaxID=2527970 RepID=A0A5C5UU74_9BACT|nr:TPR domain-containing glycosyltransferase [Blastopirellula retiformator]TWT29994.1 SPBc2 prophage-derived glycosyltransferase SunS [Blastopirellula retiformator]